MPRIILPLFILGILLIKHTTEDVIIKRVSYILINFYCFNLWMLRNNLYLFYNLCFQRQHAPQTLTLQNIATLSSLTHTENLNKLIDGILVPRVVGTPGHENVKNFITGAMRDLNWQVDFDAFEDKTPIFGKLKFENIIATLNPNAERFLVLACHYDSKYFPNEEFLGATDSAVPCAMLINIAHEMNTYLQKIRNNNDLSIKFIFFDGEEAFKEWGPNDSIYGARHLAEKWENEGFLPKIVNIYLFLSFIFKLSFNIIYLISFPGHSSVIRFAGGS